MSISRRRETSRDLFALWLDQIRVTVWEGSHVAR